MDILEQLKIIYNTLEKLSISGSANVDKMYGCFYVLTQVIQELEVQKKEMLEQLEKEKAVSN